MKKNKRFNFALSTADMNSITQLAEDEGLSKAALLRRLIMEEARKRGLMITETSATPEAPGRGNV